MVGEHVSRYSLFQSHMINGTVLAWFTVRNFFSDWSPGIPKILGKICLLFLSPAYIVFAIVLSLLTLIGYLVNLFPLIRFLYSLIFTLLFLVAALLAALINLYDIKHYESRMKDFDSSFVI